MKLRHLPTFLRDEAGAVTVEMVLWMAFLVPAASALGQQVVSPLIQNAAHQAELNQESLALIERAEAMCQGVTQ